MQATDHALGLRERKKTKTRQTIRREAFRLIEENGYAATTVEQIADDRDPMILDAPAQLPPDLSPIQGFRRAYEITIASMSADQRQVRTVSTVAEAVSRRTDRAAGDFEPARLTSTVRWTSSTRACY